MNFGKLFKTVLRVARIALKSAPAVVVAVSAVKAAAKGERGKP